MKNGFTKITFDKTSENFIKTPTKKPNKLIKFVVVIFFLFLGFTVILVLIILALIKDLYPQVQNTVKIASETYTTIKGQDVETAKVKLGELDKNLKEVQASIGKISWFGYLPWIGFYQKDMVHMINGSIAGVNAMQITINTLIPYSDLLGLKGKSTFVSGSADERIKFAVETLDKVTPKLEEISKYIQISGKELEQIDPNRYPENIGSIKIKSKLVSAKETFAQTAEVFVKAQPLLKNLPDILGNKTAQTYLVIFQNDAELRATGGFITGYAIFKLDKGKMQVVKADDIYKLDESKRKTFPAPPPILKYHKNVNYLELRDSNLSPDYIESMKVFEKMLKESVPDFGDFNGIISVDTHVLVSAIKILGDFNIYGRTFNAENDKRCDCPKAIYELEDYSTKPVAYVREDRKDIIGVLLYQIMQRALGISPSKYWGKLFQMVFNEAEQKHVLFYLHNTEAQTGIEALNYAGRISATEADYLHINSVNFAGAKSNMFIKQYVKQDISKSSDGGIVKTLTITYKNPTQASNCNLEAGQLCLNGILRNWIRVYVPKGSQILDFKGSEKDTVTYEELGKTVFEGFLTVKPQGAAEVQVQYKLPKRFTGNNEYNLLVQKQPGLDAPEYILTKNNKQIMNFLLQTDKNISVKL